MTHETDDRPSQTRSDSRKRLTIRVASNRPELKAALELVDYFTRTAQHYQTRMNELKREKYEALHAPLSAGITSAEIERLSIEWRLARARALAAADARDAVRKKFDLPNPKRG